MGFFDNIKGMFGMSEAQREAKRIQERTQRENSLEADNINYILRCIDVFNSDASASVRLAHLGKAQGTRSFWKPILTVRTSKICSSNATRLILLS